MKQPNVFDELSRRLYGFNRTIIKRAVLANCYGRVEDKWMMHIIRTELDGLMAEHGVVALTSASPSASSTRS